MKIHNLENMIGGWFIGNFEPTVLRTDKFEVAVKKYKKGDTEKRHVHKIATEITLILTGCVDINGNRYSENEIVTILPNEWVLFKAIDDTITIVVKTPSVSDDKYLEGV